MARTVLGVAFGLIILSIGIGGLFGNSIINTRIKADREMTVEVENISNDLGMIILIGEASWDELSVQRKLDVFQVVANIERYRLGIPNELNVGVANLKEGTKGYYSDRTHEIILSLDSLLYDSPWEILDCVCHEAYHSYEHRIVEAVSELDEKNQNLSLFQNAVVYANEFANYVDGEENYCAYYNQECESDAREYAEMAVEYYYLNIAESIYDEE